jgi:hypothetical protein
MTGFNTYKLLITNKITHVSIWQTQRPAPVSMCRTQRFPQFDLNLGK